MQTHCAVSENLGFHSLLVCQDRHRRHTDGSPKKRRGLLSQCQTGSQNQGVGGFLPTLPLACRWPPLAVLAWSPLCVVCVLLSSSKDVCHTGSGPTLMATFYLSHLSKGPLLIQLCAEGRGRRVRASARGFGGWTVQSVTQPVPEHL